MNIFIENHQLLLKSLIKHEVNFLLVGGYAVIYYGYKRTTGDMDLWIEPSNENKLKLIKVLKEFEFDDKGIEYINQLDFTKHLAFHFWEEPERVDCLTRISVVNFKEAFEQKVVADIEGINVPIIQYKHLIISKLSSDRIKDKADVDELQKVNRHKPNE
ncbi:MAG: nucleotidyltransferase [Burkholderiales bacterium]|nr:nucleotidyltransferase [Bacteroidia bacterium]